MTRWEKFKTFGFDRYSAKRIVPRLINIWRRTTVMPSIPSAIGHLPNGIKKKRKKGEVKRKEEKKRQHITRCVGVAALTELA